jgi:hypothetical protein
LKRSLRERADAAERVAQLAARERGRELVVAVETRGHLVERIGREIEQRATRCS